jgi:hypothetical protein
MTISSGPYRPAHAYSPREDAGPGHDPRRYADAEPRDHSHDVADSAAGHEPRPCYVPDSGQPEHGVDPCDYACDLFDARAYRYPCDQVDFRNRSRRDHSGQAFERRM